MTRLNFTAGLLLGLSLAIAASVGTYALAQYERPSDMPRVGEPRDDTRDEPRREDERPTTPATIETVRYEVIKLVHARKNGPQHQLLFYGPKNDYRNAASSESLAQDLFKKRLSMKSPDDLVNLLASNGWEPFSHDVVIHRGNGADIDNEYWMLRRPIIGN